jgi:hypothetical protein
VKSKGWQKSTRRGGGSYSPREKVVHGYTYLVCVPLYALPFTSGEEVELHLEPYSVDKMVCIIKDTPYLIHRPTKWEPITKTTVKVCKYVRTEYKGFLL